MTAASGVSPNGPTSLATLRAYWDADLAAHHLHRWTLASRFRYPVVHYQRLLRIVEMLRSKQGKAWRVARFFYRYRLNRLSLKAGVTVPPGVFGPGLSIAHYGSIVVNTRTRVGALCRIHSATNIGIADGGVPKIGDRVYIGPGAVIYGDISVGDDVVIGANSVVNKDVPPGVTVAGAPARIIARTGSAKVMPNWYPTASDVKAIFRS